MSDSQTTRIAESVARGKREILADVAAGRVPSSLTSFSELHDHVDANVYGGLCDDDAGSDTFPDHDAWMAFGNEVQEALHQWIVRGGLRPPRYLVLRYDVTGLTDEQISHLEGAAYAQGEAEDDGYSDTNPDYEGYPDVRVTSRVEDADGNEIIPAPQPRTILIHLNVEVAADDPRSADEIISLVERGVNTLDNDPQARGVVIDTALAEEV